MTVQHAQAAARYQAIADLLAADGCVDVVDIANRLGVAQETNPARPSRDGDRGKLQRVHGGAVRSRCRSAHHAQQPASPRPRMILR